MLRPPSLALLVVLAGCGAKTGADVDPPAERAFDAGFDTFPCRWSLAQATIVARSPFPFDAVGGAIHPVRDEALILWRAEDFAGGARLILGDPPPVVETFDREVLPHPSPSAIHGVRLADPSITWVTLDPDAPCRLLAMGEAPPWREALEVPSAAGCRLERHDPARVDLTVAGASSVGLWSASDLDVPTVRSVPVDETSGARSVRLEGFGWIAIETPRARVIAHRVTDAGTERADVGAVLGPVDVAADRVRHGAVVLRQPEPSMWSIERIPFEGPVRALPVGLPMSIEHRPFRQMTTNETEALVPLRDGRVAVFPLDGSAVRFIGPVPETPVDGMRVVLRPGTSGGGLLYTHVAAGEHNLVFRPLTCNR